MDREPAACWFQRAAACVDEEARNILEDDSDDRMLAIGQ